MHDFLTLGGPVLWIILAFGVLALGVFLERSLQLHRDRVDATDFLQGIFKSLRRGNAAEAAAICDETPGPVARLASLAIRRKDSPRDRLERELADAGAAEIARMERRLSLLPLVAQIAPLLGLLGTVLGILRALLFIRGQIPLMQTADVADGLILGAVTTAAGLIVAIPAHVGFNVLAVKIERLVLDMRDASSELLEFFHPAGQGQP